MRKNRRVERARLKGVKRRSRKQWRLPGHLLSTIVSMVFVILTGVFLLWRGGNWLLDELFYENGFFTIQRVKIVTDGVIDRRHYQRWARIHEGENLLKLDLSRVKRDLEFIPWVAEAAVKRVLPDTVFIQITERDPVALLSLSRPVGEEGEYERLFCQVDAQGFVSRLPARKYLDPNAKLPDYGRLPRILPSGNALIQEARYIDTPAMRAALDFLSRFDQSALRRKVRLTSIDLANAHHLDLRMEDGGRVIIAAKTYAKQLARWAAIEEAAEVRGKAINFLDLSVTNYVPVKWRDVQPSITSENNPGQTEIKYPENV